MDEYRKANLELWNGWTEINMASAVYDVAGFKEGKTSLNSLELGEVGDVSGKSLLHLQCHFGKDTLSWARLGATVTGADFSDRAIETARGLSEELGIPATFVQSDIYELPDKLDQQFDIVFTSYGALSWLPDIYRWAQVAAGFVKPGGFLYVAEFHPFPYVMEYPEGETKPQIMYPYSSPQETPLRFETKGNYADPDSDHTGVEYSWNHSLGDIVTAVIQSGLRLEFLHEHHFTVEGSMWKGLEASDDGYFRFIDQVQRDALPLLFSLKAAREE